jgi:energy-coupling factor transporter ATP-binding protein EcfA2
MTATPDRAPVPGVDRCLAALDAAIEAGRELGLDTAAAEAVRLEARERLGLAADAYVLALVGGTGVGKSSLLNALAGQEVSRAGSRRPTTAAPVAWLASRGADRLEPLLHRLEVTQPQLHDRSDLAGVVVLDLPDIDSVDEAHRATVEELLPRVDAVAWIVDPEKYADAILHDAFLRRWIPRLGRQLVVLNKADRLAADDVGAVRDHLDGVLADELAPGGGPDRGAAARPAVMAVSALGGPDGIEPLHAWLGEAADAKAVVAGRLGSAAAAGVHDLAAAAGLGAADDRRPLVPAGERRRAIEAVTAGALRVVDLPGVERQAVAATRARARRRGAGPLGALTALLYRASGREARVADPAASLRAWRSRGSLAAASVAVRDALGPALPAVPPAFRPRLL